MVKMSEYRQIQGKRIETARFNAGYTQEGLAEAISKWGYDVSRGTISNLEAGKPPASRLEVVLAIVDLCGDALVANGVTQNPLAFLLLADVDRVKPGYRDSPLSAFLNHGMGRGPHSPPHPTQ